jgi:multisubunit Na+/H+ antiporter MnhG subunit
MVKNNPSSKGLTNTQIGIIIVALLIIFVGWKYIVLSIITILILVAIYYYVLNPNSSSAKQ